MKLHMGKFLLIIIMCLLPLSAVAYLIYSLETYNTVVHNECGANICIHCVHMFFLSLIIWAKYKKTGKYITCVFVVSALVLCGVFYVGTRIPFCPVCDGVTGEDLGFLARWISVGP